MSLVLYAHPFSSYCWKVLVPLWENGIAFDYRSLDDPAAGAAMARLSPAGKFPLLVDGDTVVPEATIIIEYLQQRLGGPVPMLPADPIAALEVRKLDRLADNYLMAPMQAIVADRLRPEAERDPTGVAKARLLLGTAYAWWDAHMRGRKWAADAFGLADCAAMPALFYADWLEPIPETRAALRSFRARLLARPSMARAVDEARPYRALFPFGDPGRD